MLIVMCKMSGCDEKIYIFRLNFAQLHQETIKGVTYSSDRMNAFLAYASSDISQARKMSLHFHRCAWTRMMGLWYILPTIRHSVNDSTCFLISAMQVPLLREPWTRSYNFFNVLQTWSTCYSHDIIIATEIVEDHLLQLWEMVDYFWNGGYKNQSETVDFVKQDVKHFWRAITPKSMIPDKDYMTKLQQKLPAQNQWQLVTVNCWELCAQVCTMIIMFDQKGNSLIEHASTLPMADRRLVWDNEYCNVGFSGLLKPEPLRNGIKLLHPIHFVSKYLNPTQIKHFATMRETFAGVILIKKSHQT